MIKSQHDERYRCGDCGIESEESKWVFDWEDTIEGVVWLVCPHCSTRGSKESLTNPNN